MARRRGSEGKEEEEEEEVAEEEARTEGVLGVGVGGMIRAC